MAYSGLGNHPNALDHLNNAVTAGIRKPDVLAAKGKAELSLGRYHEAITSLDTALDLAGTDVPDYMADLARAYEGARMPKDAGATWAALARINPSHPALLEREQQLIEKKHRRNQEQAAQAMVQMQKEQRASDTACWICLIIRILLECL
jgi:tetratricopeptide (TPR) repeat protein